MCGSVGSALAVHSPREEGMLLELGVLGVLVLHPAGQSKCDSHGTRSLLFCVLLRCFTEISVVDNVLSSVVQ